MVRFLPLLSTFCIVMSALFVARGWYLIVKGRKEAHEKTMVVAAVFAVLFFTIYITRTIMIGNTSFGGPANLKPYYITFLLFHISLAVIGVTFGVVTISYARKQQFKKHKRLGRWAAVIWFISAVTGITVYFLLYVIWEPGAITNMGRAILG